VKDGFTLIELLVVIAVIALLLGILMPVVSRVRQQAKVVAVNMELSQIALALETYMTDNDDSGNGQAHPPTRKDCSMGWEDLMLPPELVQGGYLPAPDPNTGMSAGMEDRFNPGHTYRYCAVGQLIQNGKLMTKKQALLYIPPGFPDYQPEGPPEDDIKYSDPWSSPVTWAIYSEGPRFDEWEMIKQLHCPVPKRTWYDPQKRKGVIVRMRLKKGRHIGSFESRG
jgi:prepilin-type N-terminal cleavage/methylation domain-containing protein